MKNEYEPVWENYTSSWKAESDTDKRELYSKSLAADCKYTDPLAKTKGYEELLGYMLDFHKQIPGGYFVTTYFQAHNNRSIAKWEMRNGKNAVLGEGVSYGEYNAEGKVRSMTGLFETPKA